MIIRDCIVDGRRMIHAKEGTVVAANWFGKWKTILQMVGISIIFFLFNTSQPSFNSNNLINLIFYFFVQNIAVIFALILSIISGFIYFFKNKK
jgi:CDP-diacylglycerol--glycerol-3-phosphate 3-phosphatidyltransferase